MEIKSFSELTEQDQRVRYFTPLGLSVGAPVLTPESSLRFVQQMIAEHDLCPAVPETVPEYFELSRRLHVYGYFAYEFFTEASFRAHFSVELALKVRFLEFYQNRIPLIERQTERLDTLQASDYMRLTEAMDNKGSHPYYRGDAKKGWFLQNHPKFNGSLNSLMDWAVETSVLRGRRIEETLDVIRYLRNLAAHPTGTTIVMPPDSVKAIRRASDIINQLWGEDQRDAVVAASPPKMSLFAIQQSPSRRSVSPIANLPQMLDDERSGHWVLLEAAEQDANNLLNWRADYELTLYPTAVIWSGDSWEGAVAAWQAYREAGRAPSTPEWRNRIFLVRRDDTGCEPRRSSVQFLRLDPAQRDQPTTRWEAFRSDRPTEEDAEYILYWESPMWDRDNPWSPYMPPPGEKIGTFATWEEACQRLGLSAFRKPDMSPEARAD